MVTPFINPSLQFKKSKEIVNRSLERRRREEGDEEKRRQRNRNIRGK